MKFMIIFVALGAFGTVQSVPGLLGNLVSGSAAALDTAAQNLLKTLPPKFSNYLTEFPEQLKEFLGQSVEKQADSLKNFLKNLEIMKELEASTGGTFQTGLNEFSMISNEMFNFLRNRLTVPSSSNSSPSVGASAPERKRRDTNTTSLPASVDWTGTGAVAVVKNQGSCGACWAFAANGAAVGAWYAKYGNATNLSEQNLIDCVGGKAGCSGGWMTDAYNYIKNNAGINTEASYPYKASKSLFCRYNRANRGVTVSNFVEIPNGDEDAVAAAVARHPVATGMDAHKLQYYKSGFYTCTGNVTFNHGVVLVGYGVINGTNAWIVKNSWGPTWGAYKGYFYVPKDGTNQCGIVSYASYPIPA